LDRPDDEIPGMGAQRVRALFDELLTAWIVYFDTPRWQRARHSLSFLGGEEQVNGWREWLPYFSLKCCIHLRWCISNDRNDDFSYLLFRKFSPPAFRFTFAFFLTDIFLLYHYSWSFRGLRTSSGYVSTHVLRAARRRFNSSRRAALTEEKLTA